MSEQKILLVDDDPEIVKTVKRYLQHEGYAVLVAYNGKDALDFVREQAPDCIVLDVMLPDYNSWEITERIRANPRTAKIPIIMLTARVDDEEKVFGLDLGTDDYVAKPFNPHELLARIRARLRRSQQPQSPQELRVGELHMDIGGRTSTLVG
jgi:DNA-binding response OmpR family regulator